MKLKQVHQKKVKRAQISPAKIKQDDSIWKSILEEVFFSFLKFFFPKDQHFIDFESEPIFLDKEFDKLFKSVTSKKGL
ncbi:hypothetical protein SAMN05216436_1427 [bacterium A37T11]|nr:hypothetical protein SAMN05216436_1427 [bacterium A37T11]